jgi:hypothetical protein
MEIQKDIPELLYETTKKDAQVLKRKISKDINGSCKLVVL